MVRFEGGGMAEGKDPAIKLFGREIPLQEEQLSGEEEIATDLVPAMVSLKEEEKDPCKEKANTENNAKLNVPENLDSKESLGIVGLGSIEEDQKSSSEMRKDAEESKSEQDNRDIDISGEDKLLKKPDKILQCPRCSSMDTKFCYYNNYNVNQPRHFCKNCQRYWTAGGTMRNVPVGAGRRKNKHSSSNYRHMVVAPDALAPVQLDGPDLVYHEASSCGSIATKRAPLTANGTVLKFGPDTPLCESVNSVLNLGEQKISSELEFATGGDNREETSCSSVTASKHAENALPEDAEPEYQNGLASLHHLQFYPAPPWAYAWNSGWSSASAMASSPELFTGIPWSLPPMATSPAFCAPFSYPFVPASLWSFPPNWASGPWNTLPFAVNNNGVSPSSSTGNSHCSGNAIPTLGKHYRDTTSNGEEMTEKLLWVPKTLRIDDIDEAAKNSIFATLGIKANDDGVFKAFHPNSQKGEVEGAIQMRHANPAALSRSQSFQEATT